MATSAKKKPAAKAAPRVKALPTAPTPVSEWKAEAQGQLLELPSGKVARVKMPGMQAFLTANLIPNDLMPIVLKAIQETKPMQQKELEELQSKPEMLIEMSNSIDKIFMFCVVEPKVYPVPDKDEDGVEIEEREPDWLYVDEVDLDDKSYVFQCAVGGTRDVAQFRAEQAAAMADLQPS